MVTSLSTSVSILLCNYVGLIALLPAGSLRAFEAQARKSVSALFGLDNPDDCGETSSLLKTDTEDLTVNIWQLMRAYERAVWKLPLEQQKPSADTAFNTFCNVFDNLLDKLSADGMKIVAFEDCPYEPGDTVEVENIDDFAEEHGLMVSEMLEPIILDASTGKPVRFGKIRVSRKGEFH